MGLLRKRVDHDGTERFMAIYRDAKGRVRSAGTFTNKTFTNKKEGDGTGRARSAEAVALAAQDWGRPHALIILLVGEVCTRIFWVVDATGGVSRIVIA